MNSVTVSILSEINHITLLHPKGKMARITEEQILSTIGELWLVEMRESERGWGGEVWNELFTTFKEAQTRFMEINKGNPTDHVPDYYVVASNPRMAKVHFD